MLLIVLGIEMGFRNFSGDSSGVGLRSDRVDGITPIRTLDARKELQGLIDFCLTDRKWILLRGRVHVGFCTLGWILVEEFWGQGVVGGVEEGSGFAG